MDNENEADVSSIALPIPESRFWKTIYGSIVFIAPIIWFSFIYLSFKAGRPWQSGDISTFTLLSMMPNASWPFFPLLIYSTICLCLLLYDPAKYKEYWCIRLGVYTGALLALQYCIQIFVLYFSKVSLLLMMWLLPIVIVWGAKFLRPVLVKKWGGDFVEKIYFFLLALGLFGLGVGIVFVMTLSAFLWVLLITGAISISLMRCETKWETQKKWSLAIWLLYYILSWRLNYIGVLELYSTLPKALPPPFS
jgi:hypothetical protein